MNRHNLPLAWHAATDMSAIGWVMIAYSSNCLISQEWLASIAEGDSIINATLLYLYCPLQSNLCTSFQRITEYRNLKLRELNGINVRCDTERNTLRTVMVIWHCLRLHSSNVKFSHFETSLNWWLHNS